MSGINGTPNGQLARLLRFGIILTTLCAGIALSSALSLGSEEGRWFVEFEREPVTPVERDDTANLVEIGTLETDGFREVILSLGGEFKGSVPTSGVVGAILVPDLPAVDYLMRNEGQLIFPIEVAFQARGGANVFMSPQVSAQIAFPRYRVFLYNETSQMAELKLFAYRTR